MLQQIFIVAKEDSIPLAAASYDLIKKKEGFNPTILLITPIEEIIFKKAINKYFSNRTYIPCWENVKKFLLMDDLQELLKNKNNEIFNKINYEVCSHPTQLYDLNKRLQFKRNNPNNLKKVLYAQALHLDEILKKYSPQKIIDFSIYDVSRTLLFYTSKKHGIKYNSIIRSRFENYVFCTSELGLDIPEKLFQQKLDQNDYENGLNAINNFKSSNDFTAESDRKFIPKKFDINQTLKLLIGLIKRILIFFIRAKSEIDFYLSNRKLFKFRDYLIGNCYIITLNSILKDIRNLYRLWVPLKEDFKLPNNFIYFPLPNTVENSETRFNNGILSEKILINFLRARLGKINLLIKDHRSMLRDRTFNEINTFSNIANVNYISEWNNIWKICNPYNLINYSLLNITIAGTAGLEAAILEKPVAIIGKPIYGRFFELKGHKINSINQINRSLINGHIKSKEFIVDRNIVLEYISATIKISIRANVYFLSKDPFKKIFQKELNELINFLIKS